ncbi:hypothetical protein AVEN_164141-1, partial [Araneus ventricosus]
LGKPIFSPVYDLEDFTYAKAVYMKALQYLLYGVKMLIDNYPECVKSITVLNGKSPLESDQVNVKATLRNHHTRLVVPRIPPPGTASLMMLCAQAHRHVGTIRSEAENKQVCI